MLHIFRKPHSNSCFKLIFDQGRTLRDPDIPNAFREQLEIAKEQIWALWKIENIPREAVYPLFSFLCSYGEDLSDEMVAHVKNLSKHGNPACRNFWGIFGSLSEEWQEEVLASCLGKLDMTTNIAFLSEAAWRTESFVLKLGGLGLSTIREILQEIVKLLKIPLNAKKQSIREISSYFRVRFQALELLLALLRLRQNKDEEFQWLLGIDSPILQEIELQVDRFWSVIEKYRGPVFEAVDVFTIETSTKSIAIKIPRRVPLIVEKPSKYKNIPDLFYALKVYIFGSARRAFDSEKP